MAKRFVSIVLKSTYFFLSCPVFLISFLLIYLNVDNLKRDFYICVQVIDNSENLPLLFIQTLIAAEDHRNYLHYGVDYIALLRAIYMIVFCKKLEGGSTIEQQFVRTVLKRYEKTLSRKIREQILAISLTCKRTKYKIASAYISIAYYGTNKNGIESLFHLHNGIPFSELDKKTVAEIISRLKYPEPLFFNEVWFSKIKARIGYIEFRLDKNIND